MSARALDHLVLPCVDLGATARWYADHGFQVGRRNRHPWGTENHIIQFPGLFLEIIALAPDFTPLSRDDAAFPFAGYLAGQGRSRDPSGMIVLRSSDTAADAALFRDRGLGAGPQLHFSRDGVAPDGSTRTVAFSLAFAEAEAWPDIGLFTCQQHHPDNFWDPAKQVHPNGATGVGTVMIAAEAGAGIDDMSRFCDVAPHAPQGAGRTLDLANTTLRIIEGNGPARLHSLAITGAASSADLVVKLGPAGPSLA